MGDAVTALPGPAPAAGEPRLTASERAAMVVIDIWAQGDTDTGRRNATKIIAAAISDAERAAARAATVTARADLLELLKRSNEVHSDAHELLEHLHDIGPVGKGDLMEVISAINAIYDEIRVIYDPAWITIVRYRTAHAAEPRAPAGSGDVDGGAK